MGDVTGLVLPRPARRIAGPEEPHPPETPRGASHPRPWWQFWRSPPDQPPWARPALLAVAALASFSYFWGIGNATLETFYGGAVRSMSESWRNFFFGAFDPWGTVTLDKLPGAFWVQALSVRAFGFHVWSVVLPQALEGTLTVLVLFRAVRRVAGAAAGLVAAIVLAVTPVVILLDRGNVSDTLLILLLVLAADAVTAATRTGRVTHLLVASLWVGLAFQAKMLEAWVVLPALWGAYVLAAPNPVLARRLGHALVCAAVAVVVSLSYMTVVTMVPTADRPYVDGSCNDSLFTQVFEYNGAGRTNGAALEGTRCNPTPAAVASVAGGGTETTPLPDGPGRFLSGGFARDVDLMLVPAVVALGGVFMSRRRAPGPTQSARLPSFGEGGSSSPGPPSRPHHTSTGTTWQPWRHPSPRSADSGSRWPGGGVATGSPAPWSGPPWWRRRSMRCGSSRPAWVSGPGSWPQPPWARSPHWPSSPDPRGGVGVGTGRESGWCSPLAHYSPGRCGLRRRRSRPAWAHSTPPTRRPPSRHANMPLMRGRRTSPQGWPGSRLASAPQ